MQTKTKSLYDNRLLGFFLGILVPVMAITMFYLYRDPENFQTFYQEVVSVNILSRLVSLCVLPNLLVFFVFIWTHKYKSAHGVIGATFVYALIVLILTQV
jgi:uncharacterized membrane protein